MSTTTLETDMSALESVTRHVVGQVIRAITSHDWEALAACVAPNIVYWRPGTGDRVDGAHGYLQEWQRFVGTAAKLRYLPHTFLIQGDTAMVEASAEGQGSNGKPFSFMIVSIMRVADGRVVEEREYIVPNTQR